MTARHIASWSWQSDLPLGAKLKSHHECALLQIVVRRGMTFDVARMPTPQSATNTTRGLTMTALASIINCASPVYVRPKLGSGCGDERIMGLCVS